MTSSATSAAFGGPGSQAYPASDLDNQSLSGLSASELGQDDSGDESGLNASYHAHQNPSNAAHVRRSFSRSGSTAQSSKGQQSNTRPSASRSQSRQRNRPTSAATPRNEMPDFLDDHNDAYGPLDEEDDEVVPYDRGEELVRRRMRARQKEKRKRENEAEKKKQMAAQQKIQGSIDPALPPSSPRPTQHGGSAARAVSPPPAALDRDGRPTYISLPRAQLGDQTVLSPSVLGPASSPGPVQMASFRHSVAGSSATTTYPSPDSHIRRPSAPGGPASTAGRRASAAGPRTGSYLQQQRGPTQRQDVFYDGPDAKSSVAASSDNDEGGEDDGDEGRDRVADLRGTKGHGQQPEQTPRWPSDRRMSSDEGTQGDVQTADEGQDGQEEDDNRDAGELDNHDDNDDDDAASHEDSSSLGDMDPDDVEYTLKDRQDAINIEHPFGLPIWKPALYKKSRTVTRNAESALHSIPSRAAERHLLPGNLLWTVVFGIWLSVICVIVSLVLRILPLGGTRYARVAWELAGYLFWPFGKYVEVEISPYTGERSAPARIDGNNKWSFIDEDGGIGEDDDADDAHPRTYTNAFTPVAARFPHDHEHRIPFNSRPSRPQSRHDLSLETHDTIRPGDVPYDTPADAGAESSGSGSSSSNAKLTINATPRAVSNNSTSTVVEALGESAPLKGKGRDEASYGAIPQNDVEEADAVDDEDRVHRELKLYEYVADADGRDLGRGQRWLGALAWGVLFWAIIAPILGCICLACWAGVVTIPMAKLSWVLIKNLARRPLALHFGSALEHQEDANKQQVQSASNAGGGAAIDAAAKKILMPLKPGQAKVNGPLPASGAVHPLSVRRSKILLCTYRAIGAQYYKYTVGGVNILFVNTLPFVGFTIFDFFFLEPYAEKHHLHNGFIAWVSSQSVIFVCALGSVIPLSYFIGMAVASISAQSSIGMGAVINATFGSIIEIILYAIALTQEKARLVEGSIIGSILAGVLLMPGLSMCSGATRRKEQRFNARSAGVTSTMLIMAIIGILTPTLFYQIYGTFQLTCTGCPTHPRPGQDWACKRCFYEHVPPATDPFYQENVKGLMYTCTVILVLSYGIGLWFSLRTHASQIWQNPQPAPAQVSAAHHVGGAGHLAMPVANASADPHGLATAPSAMSVPSAQRASIYKKLIPASVMQQLLPLATSGHSGIKGSNASAGGNSTAPSSSAGTVRLRGGAKLDDLANRSSEPPPLELPEAFSQEDYAKAMALTASAFQTAIQQHQQAQQATGQQQIQRPASTNVGSRVSVQPHGSHHQHPQGAPNAALPRGVSVVETEHEAGGGHGGHDAPSWSRGVSLTVLLSCTVLYAIIAEILVDVVDVVLDGSGIDEKFLGVTLFALVPNTTEFMNAMSFAINGNIALSMEIGSAYALQVCLIQIPAMVAWSAYYNRHNLGSGGLVHRSFTLIFPRWDVIAIIFSVFLLTYTYIEARSNYYRGSICILSYLVLVAGFFFAPGTGDVEAPGDGAPEELVGSMAAMVFNAMSNVGAREPPQWGWLSWIQAVWGALYTR